jgi:hypothetical protein
MLMTPSIASLAVTWLIGCYVSQRAGIGINAGRIRGINSKIRGEKLLIQVLSHSSKSLKQLLDAVHKTGFAVEVLLSTFQSGTKK